MDGAVERVGCTKGRADGRRGGERVGCTKGRADGRRGGERVGCTKGRADGRRGGERVGCTKGRADGRRGGERVGCNKGRADGRRGGERVGCTKGRADGRRGGERVGCTKGRADGRRGGGVTYAINSKRTAYISLVRSVLEHGAIVWDPYHQSDINRFQRMQHRAARLISGDYRSRYEGCVSTMVTNLGLQSRRRDQRLQFMFRVVEGSVPAIHSDKFLNS